MAANIHGRLAMPKLERLEWIAPLREGRGVTLTDDPEADRFLGEDPNALLLGVLYDSQFSTRKAFAIPLKLKQRLGHLDMARLASEDTTELVAAFRQSPALHRFPRKFAEMTQQLAADIVADYGGDASRIWREAEDVDDLGERLMDLPCFGVEKTNWTVGMLGRLGDLSFDSWEDYRVKPRKRAKAS
jgi:uncharacterized HhH-GPD family protein